MSLTVTEATVGMWSVDLLIANWLAELARAENGKHVLTYRIRFYRDEKIFDSADQRTFHQTELSGTEQEVLRKVRVIFDELCNATPTHHGWELIRGARSVEEFLAVLGGMPGMHMRKEPAESAA